MSQRLTYEEAKIAIRELAVKPCTLSEYKLMFDKGLLPKGLPKDPYFYKGKGFISIGDLLGTGVVAPQYKKWCTYDEAKVCLSTLEYPPTSGSDYLQKYSKGLIPKTLPKHPESAYKNKGWESWGDFLSTGTIANQKVQFANYDEAKTIIQSIDKRPTTSSEYKRLAKLKRLPALLPSNAPHVYKDKGWAGWGDYLGTGVMSTQDRNFLSYDDAKRKLSEMSVPPSSQREYQRLARENKLPFGVPHSPSDHYGESFLGYPDYLSTSNLYSISKQELRIFAELQYIFGTEEISRYQDRNSKVYELDIFLPNYGVAIEYDGVYWHKNKYKSDCSKNKAALEIGVQIFRIREQAPTRGLRLKPVCEDKDVDYIEGDHLISSIQSLLRKIAKHLKGKLTDQHKSKIQQYLCATDFLGQELYQQLLRNYRDRWLTYEEARVAIASMSSPPTTQPKFAAYAKEGKLPDGIPKDPAGTYKHSGWNGWGHFLKTGNKSTSDVQFASFEDAKSYLKSLGDDRPQSRTEYTNFVLTTKLPISLPKDPYNAYSKELNWNGIQDFLGNKPKADFLCLKEAKELLAALPEKISSIREYKAARKKNLIPQSMPSDPPIYYSEEGWVSWQEFLGYSTQAIHTNNFATYEEAKLIIRSLPSPPQTYEEYRALAKANMLPKELPKDPYAAYKDKGWAGTKDYLGK